MKPQVSIIIPFYNREHLILETLESIHSQSFQNWECILVDDHSTDESFEIASNFIKKDSRFKLFKRPNDRVKGANACRNYGFEVSLGEFVNWFDSDDIMHPEFIFQKVSILEKNNNLDGVISKTILFKETTSQIIGKENRTFLTQNTLNDFLTLKISWYLQDVMWKISFFKSRDQFFDERILAGQDGDFFARVLLESPILEVVDSYLTYYRKHEDNITSHIDNRKNTVLKVSHLYSVLRLIELLEERSKLSNDLKFFYFKSMMKYLPFVISNDADLKNLLKLLKRLTCFKTNYFMLWSKIIISYFSFKITGKGERLLK